MCIITSRVHELRFAKNHETLARSHNLRHRQCLVAATGDVNHSGSSPGTLHGAVAGPQDTQTRAQSRAALQIAITTYKQHKGLTCQELELEQEQEQSINVDMGRPRLLQL